MIQHLQIRFGAEALAGPGWSGLVCRLRRVAMVVGRLIVCALLIESVVSGAPGYQEYQVKAELLANFSAFVKWPEGTFAASNSPVVIGVVGKDPFDRFLEQAVQAGGRPGRPLKLRRVTTDAELRECQVLFVCSSERRRLREIRERVKGLPVLTVGETDDFLDQGGIINFLLKGQSVRFEISVESAQAAGLRVDAKLLGVANSVRGKYE